MPKKTTYSFGKLAILTILIFIGLLLRPMLTNCYLNNYGLNTIGYVQSVYTGKNSNTRYTYYVNRKTYYGKTPYTTYEIGEKIDVLYAPQFPNISVPKKSSNRYKGMMKK